MSVNDIPSTPEHLYTWVDVDEHFTSLATRGAWPTWLLEIDAFWDSVDLIITEETDMRDAWAWLAERLGPLTVDPNRQVLLLESADGSGRPLPVQLRKASEIVELERRPRWHERRIVRQLAEGVPQPDKATFPHDVQICAFHSFKGGVGRTLHCVALARELASRQGGDGTRFCSLTPIWRLHRRDLVLNAIQQNTDQYLARHRAYELRWNRTEALRLAAWVGERADVLQPPPDVAVRSAGEDILTNLLFEMWGQKLGHATQEKRVRRSGSSPHFQTSTCRSRRGI